MIAVAEIYHARLGASGASGWLDCSAWRGGGGASIYSATGSVIHEVAANCLSRGKNPNSAVGQEYSSGGFTVRFTQAHADIAHAYIDYCRDLHGSLGGEQLVEVGLPIAHITGESHAVSTIDFGIIPGPGQTEAIVVDLKTGAGVPVLATDSIRKVRSSSASSGSCRRSRARRSTGESMVSSSGVAERMIGLPGPAPLTGAARP